MSKRIRRTPEEARRVILDAAEAVMAAHGPAGIRLTDVARAAGVSHPTVLHHFGNREGLIVALNRRTLEDLRGKLMTLMGSPDAGTEDVTAATFAAYRGGLAKRMIWLLEQPPDGRTPTTLYMLEEMVERLHKIRLSIAKPGETPDMFDSRAIIHLTVMTAFADAIIGPRLRSVATPDQEEAQRKRFEKWFAGIIDMAAVTPPA